MIAHMTRRPVLFDLTSASAAAAITPITASQNSQWVAWRGGKGDQPAATTCPAKAGADRDRTCTATRVFPPTRKDEKKRRGDRRRQGSGRQHLFQQLHRFGRRNGPYFLMPSTLRMMVTSLPTSPCSKFIPKSLRLIVKRVSPPPRISPNTPLPSPPFLKSTVSGLVTPCMVRSPETLRVSPLPSAFVLLKVIVGNCFASKKSGLFRLRSRIELCVSRLSTGTDNSTELFEGLSLSKTTVPEMSLKRP